MTEPVASAAPAARGTPLAVAFLVLLVFFWPTVWSFAGTWSQGVMHHGWLIGGLTVWLVWRHRRDFLAGKVGDPLLLGVVAGLSLFWFTATVAHIQVFHQLAFTLVVVFWALAVFGRPMLRIVLLTGATFVLAVPVWDAIVPVLQRLTTWMSGGLVRLTGIHAVIEGDLIHIPAGSFWVADGCAGTGFFVSALAVGAMYAHLMVRGWRSQLAVVSAAALMALVANWVRVGSLIVIGQVTDMQSGLIANHYGYGWILFGIGLVPFFAVAGWIERRESRTPTPPSPAPALDETMIQRLFGRAVAASGFAVIGPVLYFAIGALPSRSDDGQGLAGVIGGDEWEPVVGEERPFSWQPDYQGATVHEAPVFTDGERRIYTDRFVFRRQAQGAKLIGYPNRIADPEAVIDQRIIGPVDRAATRWVRQAVIATAEGPVLTWYWYRVGGVETVYPVHAKFLEVPAFLTRRRSAELIAISAPCEPDNCASAFQALASFTGARVAPGPPADPEPAPGQD